ncbi:MAG: VWA domain-containing protein [Phycisphaerae bacterium]|nr:VWA domain-containing protein [Phycisphaerae bacterium]
MKTYLLAMALLIGGCGGQENKPVTERDTPPPRQIADTRVVRFCGTAYATYDVVYVIDRSGSMLDIFDEVRQHVLDSVNSLDPVQRFHVIFFSKGKPKENPPRRLVSATAESKKEFEKFLQTIIPEGNTDPVPAIRRAFEVMRLGRRGKSVIYLLTDGEFPDDQKVINAIKQLNKPKRISINTILFHHYSPDAKRMLTKIAEENDGVFRFVEPEE